LGTGCSTGSTSHAANIYIPFMGILLQKEMFVRPTFDD